MTLHGCLRGLFALPKVSSDFKNACVAYIEFNDSGQLQTPQTDQVGKALSLIKAASTPRPGEISQPIIMVFAHGWKHNAEGGIFEGPKVQGLKDFLNNFREHYPNQYVDTNGGFCDAGTPDCRLLSCDRDLHSLAWRYDFILLPIHPRIHLLRPRTRGHIDQ